MAAQGKIARLPYQLREQVCQRLLDGEPASELLAWLNVHPDAVTALAKHFGGRAVTEQNLSDWRNGAFKEWQEKRARLEDARTRTQFAVDLGQAAGLELGDAADAMLTSALLEQIEGVDLEQLGPLMASFAKIRSGSVARAGLAHRKDELRHREQSLQLDREKFETQTVEKFLAFARTPEAQAILDSGKSKSVQLADLRDLMFGKPPEKP